MINPRYLVAAAAVCVIVLLWLARDVAAVKTQLRALQSHRLVETWDDDATQAADDDQADDIVAAPPPAPPPPAAAPAAAVQDDEIAFEG